jgi:predicted ATPase/class 3 adenylate cyclase
MTTTGPDAISQLEVAIAALEAQRLTLGDAVVDASIAALREKLAALQTPPPSDQQRKQVTVLFADVSGFTAMSETMDAEELGEVMNALWERLDRVISAHGGVIDKHIGDAVMALWGAETAREDDPEQAIRAALTMQAEIRDFNAEVQKTRPVRSDLQISIRIGINTGPVLLGEVGTTGEYTAMGDTVNLASRLQGAAPVRGILISHHTYQHVRGTFRVQPLEPIQVKGKAEPVQVYVVERAKPRAFRMGRRGVEGVETRMIGRQAELKLLQDALYAAMEDGEGGIITIVGDAGVGKSRLLYEFENWIDLLPETIRYFKGRARLETQHLPYALLRDLFIFRFQIQDSDRAGVAREKMEAGVGEVLGQDETSQMKAHVIGQWLGFDFSGSPHLSGIGNDAQQLRDRALMYLAEFFQATSALEPTVIFLEDVHWADDSSLDALSHLALSTPEQRLLIVCLARPTLFERRPHWGEGQPFHTRLELRPLSKREGRRLVAEILQKAEGVPEVLRELVVGGAEGNPFYIEELIRILIEDGVIVKGEERWRVEPARLAGIRVPPTLTAVLQARLDSLPLGERTVLQQASVVGRIFWDGAVARVNSESTGSSVGVSQGTTERETEIQSPKSSIENALSALRGREMIFWRETSAFAEAQEYIFKHAVLREVTYESVLKRLRRVYHALVAEWLIEHSGERAGEVTGLIADHLELAGQSERATKYLRQAGEEAAARFANAEAVAYLSRALALTPEDDLAERYALILAREKVYDLHGEREAQRRDLEALHELAETMVKSGRPAVRQQAEVALRQVKYAQATGDYTASSNAVQQAIALAKAAGAVESEAEGYYLWGRALLRQGDYMTANTKAEQALALARAARLPDFEAGNLLNLGVVAYNQGVYARARAYYEQALHLYSEIGARRGESAARLNLGVVASDQGDYASARTYYEQALRLKREIGDRQGESFALCNLGNVAFHQGDDDGARAYIERSLQLCREVSDRYGESNALCNLGGVAREQGDYVGARAYYEQALRLYAETGDRYGEGFALWGLGLLLHHQGEHENALEYSRQALTIAQELSARSVEADALTVLGHALAAVGRLDEADDAYRRALRLRRELDQNNRAMGCLAGLARVALAQGHPPQALTHVGEILGHLASNTLDATFEPFRIYLTCYRVLKVNQDPRAGEILTIAYHLLGERAAKISDEEVRRSFLEKVTAHREIVSEFQALRA